MIPPQWPAGEYVPEPHATAARRAELVAEIAALPARVTAVVTSLKPHQLDAKYNNWTARQIVHHLADSHANCFVRLRLTLTEDNPTIKPYDESKWSELPDNKSMDVGPSLAMLSAMHARMAVVLNAMTDEQFARTYYHPEYKKSVSLLEMVGLYAHHGRHHLGQIEWVMANR
jgi:uncharacterized damage-inducible protein DinB